MDLQIKIRKATINDIPAILGIVNHSIIHTTSNYHYEILPLEVQLQWFADKHAKNYPVIVADYQGMAVGFATYGMFREKIGYQYTVEHSVYVEEQFVGKGIGGLLLSELISLAKSEGYHVMVGGIDAENTGSIAFHKHYGFVENGIIKEAGYKFGKWLDLLFMQLILK